MSIETSTDNLTKALERSNYLLGKRSAFVRGVYGGLGATIGATIIIGLIFWILGQLETSPVFGEFFKNLNEALRVIIQSGQH
jgi:hypothetical protein